MIEKVKELLAKALRMDPADIDDDANILEDLGADSLDVVDMLMTLEEEFNILVPDEDVVKLKTVRAVAQYIEENQD
ncbi:MAG: acyl carrier protein [Clostridia bacterium]|nr:acyl carrier protein [Clostridia bacterium]